MAHGLWVVSLLVAVVLARADVSPAIEKAAENEWESSLSAEEVEEAERQSPVAFKSEDRKVNLVVVFCFRARDWHFQQDEAGSTVRNGTGNIEMWQEYMRANRQWCTTVDHMTDLIKASAVLGVGLTIVDKSCAGMKVAGEVSSAVASLPPNVKYFKVPNVGRECTGYVSAICRMLRESTLHDHTLFLQDDYAAMDDSGQFLIGRPGDTLKTITRLVEHYNRSLASNRMTNGKMFLAFQNHGMPGMKNIPDDIRMSPPHTKADGEECAASLYAEIAEAHADLKPPEDWQATQSPGCCGYFGVSKESILAYPAEFWTRMLQTAVVSSNDISLNREDPDCGHYVSDADLACPGRGNPVSFMSAMTKADYVCTKPVLNCWSLEGVWAPLFGDFRGRGLTNW